MRIDKLLSNLKFGSRKEVTKYIKKGYLEVNDNIIKDPAFKVDPNKDTIIFIDQEVYYNESVLLMLHKPSGYVSANKDGLHKTIFELIEEPYNRLDLNIAGRLDLDTEGLLLLTNDGTLLHNIISPSKNVMKKYYVEVNQPFNIELLTKEMTILDGKNQPFKPFIPIVEPITKTSFYMSIKEGKFHQVKRMVEQCNSEVTYLKRVSVGNLELGDLEKGMYKEVNKKRLFE